MRFYLLAFLFSLAVGSFGYMTNNWTAPVFDRSLVARNPVKLDIPVKPELAAVQTNLKVASADSSFAN